MVHLKLTLYVNYISILKKKERNTGRSWVILPAFSLSTFGKVMDTFGFNLPSYYLLTVCTGCPLFTFLWSWLLLSWLIFIPFYSSVSLKVLCLFPKILVITLKFKTQITFYQRVLIRCIFDSFQEGDRLWDTQNIVVLCSQVCLFVFLVSSLV